MIEYRTGDCLDHPSIEGCVIAHVVNDAGKWGAGFSGKLSASYPYAEESYRVWRRGGFGGGYPFHLGRVLIPAVGAEYDPALGFAPGARRGPWVAHLCAMRGVRSVHTPTPLDYGALVHTVSEMAFQLRWLAKFCGHHVEAIVMPRIGCGLAGGTWDSVEPIIREALGEFPVFVYTLPFPDRSQS